MGNRVTVIEQTFPMQYYQCLDEDGFFKDCTPFWFKEEPGVPPVCGGCGGNVCLSITPPADLAPPEDGNGVIETPVIHAYVDPDPGKFEPVVVAEPEPESPAPAVVLAVVDDKKTESLDQPEPKKRGRPRKYPPIN